MHQARATLTAWSYRDKLGKALRTIAITRITELTAPRIQAYIAQRLQEVTPATVAGDIRAISRLLSFARKRGYIDSDPLKQVERPRNISRKLPRFLSKEEIDRLLQVEDEPGIHAAITTAIYAGLRRGELVNLQWQDIDFEKGLIYLRARAEHHLKNWEERAVPLHSRLYATFGPIQKEKGPCFVFEGRPIKPDFLSRAVTCAMRKAGIKGATLHTLRHTFASHCAMAGISLLKISKWLGHRTPGITYSVYAHLEPQDGEIERI
jgi:integrase